MTRTLARVLMTIVVLASSAPAFACAVCMGDPQSKLVQGAASGILVMLGVTYALLLGFVGMAVAWFVRSRRLP
jgi:hypothetical protein